MTISDVKSRILPELDDEFAKSIGDGYEDLDDLKSQISESLQSEAAHIHSMVVLEARIGSSVDFLIFAFVLLVTRRTDHSFFKTWTFGIGISVNKSHYINLVVFVFFRINLEFDFFSWTDSISVTISCESKHYPPPFTILFFPPETASVI